MRQLVLMMGAPGAGKSTFIKEKGLEPYTLSPDTIRVMYQNPVLTKDGVTQITSANDKVVWEFLFRVLEERMKRGDFTIVDATHSTASAINQYKELCQKYRYRCAVVDFSKVPLDILLRQNLERPVYKRVPELQIMKIYERYQQLSVPGWVQVVQPADFDDFIRFKPLDFSKWRKIHHIGDIHGCYDALAEYLKDGLKEDELYIFLGDFLDRGPQNAEVMKLMLEIYNQPNVILIEGNHERYIWSYANGEEIGSKEFKERTLPDLEKAGISKKDLRLFYRRLRVLAYYTYHDKTVLVTHGGLSALPGNLMFISAEQIIDGAGTFDLDIDEIWDRNTGKQFYQIHGHRNLYRLPVSAAIRSFNLEGQVEHGGHLRVVTLTPDGFHPIEIKNNNYLKQEKHIPESLQENKLTVETLLEYMTNHKLIQEKQVAENIYSYNFSRKAFQKAAWDTVNVRARGLFINKKTKEIVNRSYNKFFNINERPETKLARLAETLQFPVSVYTKPNGYLGMLGYDSEAGQLVFSSKSELRGPFAEWFKELFYQTCNDETIKSMEEKLKEGFSFVFEVILPEKDPHIIKYDRDQLILLDVVYRTPAYNKLPFHEVKELGQTFHIPTKELVTTFDSWLDFYSWYKKITSDYSIEEEGYVIEDAKGFMTKLKLPYYLFWKQMRGVKEAMAHKHGRKIDHGRLYTPLHIQFYNWLKTQEMEDIKNASIIQLRDQFYREVGEFSCV
ncbi:MULTISPECIES: RNA ligase [unclassified Thermoactinomyces]|jgi:predicted kinase|uniref:RNA ligase n=1 Tax=unclassified Thermoactinomyces TaxID=2634588 RepID=UPI0018DD92A7|nr:MULTISPECIES: RNA ligase [unclassified Thermoactinomyces]MBH8603035.1 metallophosphoesterase [Thermoactinomyces sp. CICC 10522]MBH8609250.1 metallophosphoesterase [Thermoactinomyces sp. CICC 10521]